MSAIFARKALISKGWAANVRLGIRAGRIASLTEGADPGPGDVEVGVVIPGLCNAHRHAFQRALALNSGSIKAVCISAMVVCAPPSSWAAKPAWNSGWASIVVPARCSNSVR